MKIFVVGDVGYDNYLVGKVRGLSAEAPIPILDVQPPTLLPGMGLNVLANLHRLGATSAEVILPEGAHYPVKTRLMTEDGQQVGRFDFEDYCTPLQRADLLPLVDADAVIVADYGKGAISDAIASVLVGVSAQLFVDTKGDPSRWLQSNAILVPNQEEWNRYKAKYEWFPRVVLKQGAQGLSYVEYGRVSAVRPAWARQIGSVNGAGDTVIAGFSVAFVTYNGDIQRSLDVAAAASALVVEQGFLSRTTTPEEVGKRIKDEVPERVYTTFQTQYISPYIGTITYSGGPGLSHPQPESEIGPGRESYKSTSSVCAGSPVDAVSAMRAHADKWEDDYRWCTPDLEDIARMDEWAV